MVHRTKDIKQIRLKINFIRQDSTMRTGKIIGKKVSFVASPSPHVNPSSKVPHRSSRGDLEKNKTIQDKLKRLRMLMSKDSGQTFATIGMMESVEEKDLVINRLRLGNWVNKAAIVFWVFL